MKNLFADLPQRWQERLKDKLNLQSEELDASHFPLSTQLSLKFGDGSEATFNYAFHMEASEFGNFGEVGVFTEHCGYHIFPAGDLEITVIHL